MTMENVMLGSFAILANMISLYMLVLAAQAALDLVRDFRGRL